MKRRKVSNEEEMKRIRRKMDGQNKLEKGLAGVSQGLREELPQMEPSDKTEEENQKEVQKLREKSEEGAVGVVKKVFKQPEVQRVIKFEINREMFISGLFMAFFLVGFFKVFDVAKVTLQYNWMIDLAIGVILLAIGGIYTLHMVWQNKEPKN